MRYTTHSNNGYNGKSEITIRNIENGLVITYKHLTDTKEVFVETIEDVRNFMDGFYRSSKN